MLLLLHVTKIIDLWRAGGGYECFCAQYMYHWSYHIPKVLHMYGVRKVRHLFKPLDHLLLNGVFYPVYCVLCQLSYLWNAFWNLSYSRIFRLDSTAHTALGMYRLTGAGDIVRIWFTRSID